MFFVSLSSMIEREMHGWEESESDRKRDAWMIEREIHGWGERE